MIVSACLDKNMLSGTTWKTPDRLLYISIVVNAGEMEGNENPNQMPSTLTLSNSRFS